MEPDKDNGTYSRSFLVNVARQTFEKICKEHQNESETLVKYLESETDAGTVKQQLGQWQEVYNELIDAEWSLRRLMKEDEVSFHDANMSHYVQGCDELKSKAVGYLSRFSPQPNFDTVESLRRETEQLRAQVEQLRIQNARALRTPTPTPGAGSNLVSHSPDQPPAGSPAKHPMTVQPLGCAGQPQAFGSQGTFNPSVTIKPTPSYVQATMSSASVRGCGHEGQWDPGRVHAGYGAQSAPPYQHQQGAPGDQLLHRLVDVMESRSERIVLSEPEVFDGDVLRFPGWWSAFIALVEGRVRSLPEVLSALRKYTKGDARGAISWYLDLYDDPEAYVKAKDALLSRFGDKVAISDAFKTKLNTWPTIRKGDKVALQKYSDFLWQVHAAMNSIEYLSSLNSKEENVKMASKLPMQLAERWDRKVYRSQYPSDSPHSLPTGPYPSFHEFCSFVGYESRVLSRSCLNREPVQERGRPERPPARTHHHRSFLNRQDRTTPKPAPPKCAFCKKDHYLNWCTEFLSKKGDEKREFARANNYCYGCLRKGHRERDCTRRLAFLMQDPKPQGVDRQTTAQPKEDESEDAIRRTVHFARSENTARQSAMVVPVYVKRANCKDSTGWTMTYAMLDTQSECCFVNEDLFGEGQTYGRDARLELVTMGTEELVHCKLYEDIIVRPLLEDTVYELPDCFTRPYIPASVTLVPKFEDIAKWPHLQSILPEMMDRDLDMAIGLLIGHNMSEVFKSRGQIEGPPGKPFGFKTMLGWTVLGPVGLDPGPEAAEALCHRTKVKPLSPEDLELAFDAGFESKPDDLQKMSQEDLSFLKQVEDGKVELDDGHVQLPFPFKERPENPPDNKGVVMGRFLGLKRKLKRDRDYCTKYMAFMRDMINDGHAERVPVNRMGEGPRWYIPHQGVLHPRKPGKVRVVFDMSIEYQGFCLNKALLQGPDMTNSLVGVILRFMKEKYAVTCDIRGMFHQVRLDPEDRDFVRFLWLAEEDNLDSEIEEYRMCVHLFGATSSPGCANYALKTVADNEPEKYSDEVRQFIKRKFYVDDGLSSVPTEDEAVDLALSSHELCKTGGFWLHKFNSSHDTVLNRIPEELRAPEAVRTEQNQLGNDVTTTLGISWNKTDDCFVFLVSLREVQPTRRDMLSALASLYDPLGWLSPAVLKGRKILQRVCKEQGGWDALVPKDTFQEWDDWYQQLQNLNDVRIPRCIRKLASLPLTKVELHVFTDASSYGYGCCCYVKLRSPDGNDVKLVMAKSRVGPSKVVTIPRLELQAVVLGVKTAEMVLRELEYGDVELHFWVDSRVVLGYLANSARRFHVYVANRVQFVHERVPQAHWHHIETDQNPADLASRGVSASELVNHRIWWEGPEVLSRSAVVTIPLKAYEEEVKAEDPEVRCVSSFLATAEMLGQTKETARDREEAGQANRTVLERLANVSSWTKMCTSVGWWLRYLSILRERAIRAASQERPEFLSPEERLSARHTIVRLAQEDSFPKEMSLLRKLDTPSGPSVNAREQRKALRSLSNLYRLDIYLSADRTIRVGGRVRRAVLSADLSQPQLLPKDHFVTRSVMVDQHHQRKHTGRASTLMGVREQGFWPCQPRRLIDSVIRDCLVCKRYGGRPCSQKMGDLPVERLGQEAPFTFTAVDFFGPMLVKVGRSQVKRWGCLFVCMSSRAVHVEVSTSLSTDSFINAYRRMISRRGPVTILFCDQGTNFVGGSNEMQREADAVDWDKMGRKLALDGCQLREFRFNPPRAPHMGGSWERMVQTMKRVLNKIMRDHPGLCTDEELVTVMVEAEAVVNSRPLTCLDQSDGDNPAPITPAQLLTLKSAAVRPMPGFFVKKDLYGRRRWRRIQYLADLFWSRWRAEFLPTLQSRGKWTDEEQNLETGDIVLLLNEDVPRAEWPLARIVATYPGEDGHVRKIRVKTQDTEFERPITQVIFLMRPEKRVVLPVEEP